MKQIVLNWVLPFIVAVLLVTVTRTFFVDVVLNEDVNSYFFKSNLDSKNQLVLYKKNAISDSCLVLRKIALPGDTLRIKRGEIYVNGKEKIVKAGISNFTFKTDSIDKVFNYLLQNLMQYNVATAYIGSFSLNTTEGQLDSLKKLYRIYDVKKTYLSTELSEKDVFGNELYWNKDNIGPLIVPQKGMKMKISSRFYIIYKDVIQKETGKKLSLKNGKPFLDDKLLDIYTFKNNYCFLLNDDKSNLNDSRTFGFVKEKEIRGKYLMSL